MSFKLFKTTKLFKTAIAASLITTFSTAQAGIIIGNYEYLELDLTKNRTVAEIQAMINSDMTYAGYEIATDVEVAELWSLIPHVDEAAGDHPIVAGEITPEVQEAIKYFTSGFQT